MHPKRPRPQLAKGPLKNVTLDLHILGANMGNAQGSVLVVPRGPLWGAGIKPGLTRARQTPSLSSCHLSSRWRFWSLSHP